MLSYDLITDDQHDCIDRLYNHDHNLLVAPMGGGKTVVTLTALSELLADGVISRVLVVAPLKVCNSVWWQEAAGWSHLAHLDIGVATGSAGARKAVLDAGHDITVINFENLPWLFRVYGAKGRFDALVVDELSKLKAVGGAQFKALRPRLVDFKWRVGMTGTPVSEDWTGLFGQMLVVDGGARLGTRKDSYLRRYFFPTDFNEYNWELHPWGAEEIAKHISDVVYTMPDYRHELPLLNVRYERLPVPGAVQEAYDELRGTMAVGDVVADTAAVLSGKLMQCASGFLYGATDPMTDATAPTVELSDYKIDALLSQVAEWRAAGEQAVVCYWFQHDLARLRAALPGAVVLGEDSTAVDQWNAGTAGIVLLHPRSAGHGLNMARGGCKMIWIGPVWSRDLWSQTVARLWRRGQARAVEVVMLLGAGTVDELMVGRVEEKEEFEMLFKQHLSGGG